MQRSVEVDVAEARKQEQEEPAEAEHLAPEELLPPAPPAAPALRCGAVRRAFKQVSCSASGTTTSSGASLGLGSDSRPQVRPGLPEAAPVLYEHVWNRGDGQGQGGRHTGGVFPGSGVSQGPRRRPVARLPVRTASLSPGCSGRSASHQPRGAQKGAGGHDRLASTGTKPSPRAPAAQAGLPAGPH